MLRYSYTIKPAPISGAASSLRSLNSALSPFADLYLLPAILNHLHTADVPSTITFHTPEGDRISITLHDAPPAIDERPDP